MARPEAVAPIRRALAEALAWHEAHASFDDAVKGLAAAARGRRPPGFPHSPWELVEHMRRTQHDLLDFCRNPSYRPLSWPEDYWPSEPSPPSARAWSMSIRAYRRDRTALAAFVRRLRRPLSSPIPHGGGQTYLREVLLAIDHAAYHVGQLVAVRRALGAWPG